MESRSRAQHAGSQPRASQPGRITPCQCSFHWSHHSDEDVTFNFTRTVPEAHHLQHTHQGCREFMLFSLLCFSPSALLHVPVEQSLWGLVGRRMKASGTRSSSLSSPGCCRTQGSLTCCHLEVQVSQEYVH